jgi:hypothetical protein
VDTTSGLCAATIFFPPIISLSQQLHILAGGIRGTLRNTPPAKNGERRSNLHRNTARLFVSLFLVILTMTAYYIDVDMQMVSSIGAELTCEQELGQ